MRFKTWKLWYKSVPWTMRWFIILLLVRPVVDNLYFLKNISPFLSPLYIVGVLTPVLAIISIYKMPKPLKSSLDRYFGWWSFFIALGTALIFLFDFSSLLGIEYILKLSVPIYLYYYLRRFIRSRKDLDGLLQTFLYSAILVAGLLLYEVFVSPVRVEESRGLSRIQGGFGDVMSYATYMAFSLLIIYYFYFQRIKELKLSRRAIRVGIVIALCTLALVNINHAASYIVILALCTLFLLFNLKTNKGTAVFLIVVLGSVTFLFGRELVLSKVEPIFFKDIRVYKGEKPEEQLMHGRVGRWKGMWETYGKQNTVTQFFGFPVNFEYAYHYVGVGAHNDFMRIMFLSGYVGLMTYLLLLYQVWKRSVRLKLPQRFLLFGALSILVLYSISTTPTYYPVMMYIIMAAIAFAALPKHLSMSNE